MKPIAYLGPLLLLLALAACDLTRSDDSAATSPRLAAVALEEDETTNNLSYPVIWSDGAQHTLALRGSRDTTRFDGTYFMYGGERWYIQGDSLNEWQAESYAAPTSRPFIVQAIDWGDNLEARAWPHGQQVRVEVALMNVLQGPPDAADVANPFSSSMWAITMRSEDPTVQGPEEVWGTNGVWYRVDTAMVYTAGAQLIIQRLNKSREDPSLQMVWTGNEWTGDVGPPLFRRGVWESQDGPGGFNAEINARGRVIYGYNWPTATVGDGPGDYRITFVIRTGVQTKLNTVFHRHSYVVTPDEHEGAGPGDGGTAQLIWQYNLSYIDVRVTGGAPVL
jgi:hypothetical protein